MTSAQLNGNRKHVVADTYRFEASIHDPYLLPGELGEPAEVLQGDGDRFRHPRWFYLVHNLLDGTVRWRGHFSSSRIIQHDDNMMTMVPS